MGRNEYQKGDKIFYVDEKDLHTYETALKAEGLDYSVSKERKRITIKGKKKLYMAVTADKYELPLAVEETAKELGEHFGIDQNTVLSAITHERSGTTKGAKYIKIEMTDEVLDD